MCLEKCGEVYVAMKEVESALDEDGEGMWCRRRVEVEREARKRIPDFQVIVAFANSYHMEETTHAEDDLKSIMMKELGQRLLCLYHRIVPSMVAEARYDVGRSVLALLGPAGDDKRTSASVEGLKGLQKLHVLRMLGDNTQFSWSTKACESSSLLW